MTLQRLAAFCDGNGGGNPAGVVIGDSLPHPDTMRLVAGEVGYSETVFAAREGDAWRVRYFAPEMEVPFCGHATIALGAALAAAHGPGRFTLQLNDGTVTVKGRAGSDGLWASLLSPPGAHEPVPAELLDAALGLFGLDIAALDPRIRPALISAGARHLLLPLADRQRLAAMEYDLETGRALMELAGLVTIALVHADTPDLVHARNAFAAGGVREDPATGAAAAALGHYLEQIGWIKAGQLTILQGHDMGVPCRIEVGTRVSDEGRIAVSGTVQRL